MDLLAFGRKTNKYDPHVIFVCLWKSVLFPQEAHVAAQVRGKINRRRKETIRVEVSFLYRKQHAEEMGKVKTQIGVMRYGRPRANASSANRGFTFSWSCLRVVCIRLMASHAVFTEVRLAAESSADD